MNEATKNQEHERRLVFARNLIKTGGDCYGAINLTLKSLIGFSPNCKNCVASGCGFYSLDRVLEKAHEYVAYDKLQKLFT